METLYSPAGNRVPWNKSKPPPNPSNARPHEPNIAPAALPQLSLQSKVQFSAFMLGSAKGRLHPDSLCDGAVEAAARALCQAYLEAYGAVQHFNLDKALLIGGISAPKFGGGKVLRPTRLIVSGPVTELPSGKAELVVEQAIREYLATSLGGIGNDIRIEPIVRPSAPNLRDVTNAASLPLSNDTSFGVGYAPHSSFERAVLLVADPLTQPTPHHLVIESRRLKHSPVGT